MGESGSGIDGVGVGLTPGECRMSLRARGIQNSRWSCVIRHFSRAPLEQ
jgi:hypothetical protein